MKKLRVAIAGCGAVARHAHCPSWMNSPHTELAACCDPDGSATQRLFDKIGLRLPAYNSLADLLASERVDIVDICSPGYLHAEQASLAIEAGCNVLVEKPPAANLGELRSLSAQARARGVKIGAMFNYRYRDLVIKLQRAAANGDLGTITRINISHHGPVVFGDARWLWDEAQSRYLLWEFGIHFIDVLVHLLGPAREILHVNAIEQPGTGHTSDLEVLIAFQSGAVGRLEIAADTTRHSSAFTRIDAFGTAQDCFVRWFPPLFRLRSGVDSPMAIIADEIRATWDIASKLIKGEFIRHRNVSHERCIAGYISWVLGTGQFPLDFESIEPTLSLLDMISARIPGYVRSPEPAVLPA